MAGHIGGHFRDPHHWVHDLTFSLLLGTAALGMLAQLRKPAANVAAQVMALIPLAALALIAVFTNRWVFAPLPLLGALTLLATVLHPSASNLFRRISVSRVNRAMLALVAIAAVPFSAFAFTNLGLQTTVSDEHAALGHYGFMAAFSVTVVGAGLLASLRLDGWWIPAWMAGLLPSILGLASLVFQGESSLALEWAIAAILWGAGFVAAAELTQDTESPTLIGARRVTSRSERMVDRSLFPATSDGSTGRTPVATSRGTPPWAMALGIMVVFAAVLFGIVHVTGYSPGGHTAPIQHGVQQP